MFVFHAWFSCGCGPLGVKHMRRIEEIQGALRQAGVDGWLLYDAHGLNPIARQIVDLHGVVTRRFFVLVPAHGPVRSLYHRIETLGFAHLVGEHRQFRTWQELDSGLDWVLDGCRRVAMEYSPDNAIPYVARVDAATIEKVRARGVEVVSSADLIARFLATWSPEQLQTHMEAARGLLEIKDLTFDLIRVKTNAGETLTEYDVVLFIREEFSQRGLTNGGEGPICAVDGNAGNPHYEPTEKTHASIGRNQLVLLDLWAKLDQPNAVYGDITWVGYTGSAPPQQMADVFHVAAKGRDRAIAFLEESFERGTAVHGYEVDREVRRVITEAGFGAQFIHRTGHSIGRSVHDVGPNIDDLETQDRRLLQEGVAFTIEPGIYLPEYGVRTEINILIKDNRPVVTTLPLQKELICLA